MSSAVPPAAEGVLGSQRTLARAGSWAARRLGHDKLKRQRQRLVIDQLERGLRAGANEHAAKLQRRAREGHPWLCHAASHQQWHINAACWGAEVPKRLLRSGCSGWFGIIR